MWGKWPSFVHKTLALSVTGTRAQCHMSEKVINSSAMHYSAIIYLSWQLDYWWKLWVLWTRRRCSKEKMVAIKIANAHKCAKWDIFWSSMSNLKCIYIGIYIIVNIYLPCIKDKLCTFTAQIWSTDQLRRRDPSLVTAHYSYHVKNIRWWLSK